MSQSSDFVTNYLIRGLLNVQCVYDTPMIHLCINKHFGKEQVD